MIADSLHGGEGHGADIDALLNSLPGHAHSGANEALALMASHASAAVSFGHMGFGGSFAGHGMIPMEMMHQDAAPVAHG